MKGASVILDRMIGVSHAIELAQIVQPRLGHKRLDVALFIGRIVRQKPAEGAIPVAHTAHLVHSKEKVLGLPRVDVVCSLADLPERPPFVVAPLAGAEEAEAAVTRLNAVGTFRTLPWVVLGTNAVWAGEATVSRLRQLKPSDRP